ncbi:cupin domain-containing protein [Halodesulfurarchaeum sp.]|uniref:cupin domain-containing protein n=1 Tax=Halodesulfurarchaeum sp. TaxID=1980530 RepID=UPI002FC2D5CD
MNPNEDQLEELAGAVFEVAALLSYQDGAIVSRTIVDREDVTVTMFAVDAGQSISEHTAQHDAILHVLDGTAHVSIDSTEYEVGDGDGLVFPSEVPHALWGEERFKMLLTMTK